MARTKDGLLNYIERSVYMHEENRVLSIDLYEYNKKKPNTKFEIMWQGMKAVVSQCDAERSDTQQQSAATAATLTSTNNGGISSSSSSSAYLDGTINIYVYTHCISSPDTHTQPKRTDIYASQVHRRILNRFYYHNIGFRSHVIRLLLLLPFFNFIF